MSRYKESVVVNKTFLGKCMAGAKGFIFVSADDKPLEIGGMSGDQVLVHFGRTQDYIPLVDVERRAKLLSDDTLYCEFEEAGNQKKGATKNDKQKVDLSLLPFKALSAVAQVFEFGAKKYGRGNYRKEPKLDDKQLLAAAIGHLGSACDGEEIDADSGLPHLYHAAASILILLDQTVEEKIRERKKR